MDARFVCKPSINPFNRSYTLKDGADVYASMSIRGFVGASAVYQAGQTTAWIGKRGGIVAKGFDVGVYDGGGKRTVAVYEFGSLREFPVGSIVFSAGSRYAVRRGGARCYSLFSGSEIVAEFQTVLPRNFLRSRHLVLNTVGERNGELELAIFAVWYAMVVVGMGLNDG